MRVNGETSIPKIALFFIWSAAMFCMAKIIFQYPDVSEGYLISLKQEKTVPLLSNWLVPDLLIPGNFLKPHKGRPNEIETAFESMVRQVHFHCKEKIKFGHSVDGGYEVCTDPPYNVKENNCLVYSFGIRKDWTFDDEISKTWGCEVHSFDPSIGKPSHNRSSLIHFHDIGLGGYKNASGILTNKFWNVSSLTREHPNWKIQTLSSIRKLLNHQNAIIDYLKIDIEYSELHALPAMFQDGDLWNVKQLGFELHTSGFTTGEMRWVYLILLQLELMGFKKFHYSGNTFGSYVSKASRTKRIAFQELFYVNTNYILEKS